MIPFVSRRSPVYAGDGSTATFSFSFKVFAAADIAVQRTVSGVESTLVLNTNYTVSLNADQDNFPGGSITLTGGNLATGATLVIVGNQDYSQTTQLPTGGPYNAVIQEKALDRVVVMAQQLKELVDRSIKYPASDDENVVLPSATARASKFLAFDAGGAPIGADGVPNVPVSTFMATVLDDTTAASARATLGAASSSELAAGPGSAMVGYLPGGTGAVARTAQAKLREIASVLDFGADNTGAVGARATIQAAIDAVSAAGGGVVFIPAGTYSISGSALIVPSKVSLIGAGMGATKLVVNGGNSLVSLASGATDVVVSDIWFQGDYAGSSSSSTAVTVNSGAQRVRITRNRIADMNFNGIDVNVNNRDVVISQNEVSNCNVGISNFKGNTRCAIVDNHVVNAREYGINVDDATSSDTSGTSSPNTYIVVSGNRVLQAASGGIVVQGSSYVSVRGNLVQDCGRANPVSYTAADGIVINSGQGDFNRSQYCSVDGNTISGCTASGIKVQGANQCVISGNVLSDNWQWLSALSTTPEIDIKKNTTNGSTSILVTGNVIADNATTNGRADIGIRIGDTASSNCHIGGNIVVGFAVGSQVVCAAGSGFTKFFGHEVLSTLPAWTADQRSRLVHALVDDKLYLATNTAWIVVGTQA